MRPYYQTYNEDILPLIPPGAKVILELGCAAGALAQAYKRINPAVQWFGVEQNQEAAESARSYMADVWHQDIENLDAFNKWISPDDGMGNKIDVLICGDILEHLKDPWRVLKFVADYIRGGAQIIACIPNVQHYRVIMALLRGEWVYADDGLLDRTHLRFFDLDGIKQLFEQAGLEIFEIRGRHYGNEHHTRFMQLFKHSLSDQEWETLNQRSSAYQYIVRAVKPPCEIVPLRINDHPGEGCCERPRLSEPLQFIRTIPGVRLTSENPHITIVQRDFQGTYPPENESGVIVAEWDDDPRALPGMVASNFHGIRAAHAVMCSTEYLADVIRQWNPHVFVFSNHLANLPPPRKTRTGPVSIFCGWQNREDDWAPIIEPLNRVLADHPEVSIQVIHDRKFFDALKSKAKRFAPFCSYPVYREILRSCDIAILPLEDTPFNRCKSDIKFLECAAEGVATLMSDIAWETVMQASCVYTLRRETKLHIRACVYDSQISFNTALELLITEPDQRKKNIDLCHDYVSNTRLLSHHYRDRYDWFLGLLSRKEQLDRERDERLAVISHSTQKPSHTAPLEIVP